MSSNSSVPMEPAPPSLVERLRAWEVWELDKGAPPPPISFEEAADRIEKLERAIWQMHSEAHEHIKRIEALEKAGLELPTWDDDEVPALKERIEVLEAALREISARVIRFTYQGPSLMELDGIARRALEGKP